MKITLESLIPYQQIEQNPKAAFEAADKYGQAVVMKDNIPAYIISKVEIGKEEPSQTVESAKPAEATVQTRAKRRKSAANAKKPAASQPQQATMTLKDAAVVILEKQEHTQLHAAALADLIYKEGLYTKKDGTKAPYSQIRSMCTNYPHIFDTLPGNMIKLKEIAETAASQGKEQTETPTE
jgi:antitoxin Phd